MIQQVLALEIGGCFPFMTVLTVFVWCYLSFFLEKNKELLREEHFIYVIRALLQCN